MITSMHYGATQATFQLAEILRKQMTPAETLLWNHLSNNALGHRFRCQHPINKYVVDFYAHPVKLVIEVDGSIHSLEDVSMNDMQREMRLLSFGLHLIRFDNNEVLSDIDSVLKEIKEAYRLISTITGVEVPFRGYRGKSR